MFCHNVKCSLVRGAPSSSRLRPSRRSERNCPTWSRTSSTRCGLRPRPTARSSPAPKGWPSASASSRPTGPFWPRWSGASGRPEIPMSCGGRSGRPSSNPGAAWTSCARPSGSAPARPGAAPPTWRWRRASQPRWRSPRPRRSSSTPTSWPPTSSRAICGSSPTRPVSASAAAAGSPPCCLTPTATTPRRSRAPRISRAGRCRARWPRSRSLPTPPPPPSGAWTPTCWPGPTATARG